MLIKDAKKITYSLTRTSKMPGKSYSLPAWACQTGSKLRKIEGTPCFSCYALKGNYIRYPKIKEIQYKKNLSLHIFEGFLKQGLQKIELQREAQR